MRTLQALIGWVRQWNRRRATERTLRALPDWQLRDLGLTRDEITMVVNATLGANPARKRTIANRPRIRPQTVPGSSAGKAATT
ncbi:MAG: DUF1127 domain-containing protein [Acidiferrobacterales bacterium]|nr:DUF1127 domain-containing protein [Acidiferrobacterales bacterium]